MALATPAGALGRLGEVAVWLAGVQGQCPPPPPQRVHCAVFAGDHGVAAQGVSAYPPQVTALMVRAFAAGTAGACVLARQQQVALSVHDLAVDADLTDLGGAVGAHKVCRSSGTIDQADALQPQQLDAALAAGAEIADACIDAGADLLIGGDLGIGNTTPAAALIAAGLTLTGEQVAGRGTGVDDATLRHKARVIDTALARAGDRAADPRQRLAALGGADLAAQTAFLTRAAERDVPVLLDGVVSLACALTAEDLAPGCRDWFLAGHRSPEPAQALALQALRLEPLLDLGMRLGEGSGALAALGLVRSAALLLRDVALLEDVMPDPG